MRVSCCQMTARADTEARQAVCLAMIAEAVDGGAELIVLPELVTSGYVFTSRDEAVILATGPDDDLLAGWASALGGSDAVVVGGFCEVGPGGQLFNSAALVDRSGVQAVYRKTHLWDSEKLVFTPGDALPPVLELPSGRVGLLICYDLEFPELPRHLALAGADLLAVPTSWPLVERPPGERPPEVGIAMATARANRVAIACCDRCGEERGQIWTAGTAIVSAEGWVVASTDEAGIITADLDVSRSRDKQISERNDALGDRRPELYGSLVYGPRQFLAASTAAHTKAGRSNVRTGNANL